MTDTTPSRPSKLTARRAIVLVILSAAVALVATLVVGNFSAPKANECPVQPLRAGKIDAVAIGDLAALMPTGEGRGYADMAFTDAAGAKKTIGDFAGKALLVNFWASWCVPCRAEMPALEMLAKEFNSDHFEVLPINLDIGEGAYDKAKKFLDEGAFTHLPLYADSSFAAFERLKQNAVAIGLPATLLLDEKGCEIAVLQGPAAWEGPDGHKVIEALLAG